MKTRTCSIAAGFLEHPERRLFHLLLRPTQRETRGAMLFLHPFAEEMHMARRNVAAQARQLAGAGYIVMLLDLTGCGDGAGDFADASWQVWCDDAAFALQHLRSLGPQPVDLWGLRLGGLLACEVARRDGDIQRLLLWQPVLNGEQQVDQFLRLRTVAGMAESRAGFDRNSLWSELRAGRSLEIAGYELTSAMALEVSRSRLHDLIPPCAVSWVEVPPVSRNDLAPPSRNVAAHWQNHGVELRTGCVPGEPFWRSHDAPLNAALQQLTLELVA